MAEKYPSQIQKTSEAAGPDSADTDRTANMSTRPMTDQTEPDPSQMTPVISQMSQLHLGQDVEVHPPHNVAVPPSGKI